MIINLNKQNIFEDVDYDFREAAEIFKIKGIGRNNLYKICREMGLINDCRWPAEEYIEKNLLKGVSANHFRGSSPKTLIIGEKGLRFVRQKVEEYLKNPEEATKDVIKPKIDIDYGNSRDI